MAELNITLSPADLDALAERIAARLAEALAARPADHGEPDARLLNEREAAALFGVETHTLRDARNRGELEFLRLGKFVRYERQHLEAWKQRNASRPIPRREGAKQERPEPAKPRPLKFGVKPAATNGQISHV